MALRLQRTRRVEHYSFCAVKEYVSGNYYIFTVNVNPKNAHGTVTMLPFWFSLEMKALDIYLY